MPFLLEMDLGTESLTISANKIINYVALADMTRWRWPVLFWLRGLRWQGERGFAILIGPWKTLRHTTVSPRRIGDIVAAALHLTHYEYQYLSGSC